MTGLTQPHDKFFKVLMEQPAAAAALFRERLPRRLVYCLVEHKRDPEPRVALQLLGYMVRGWERLERRRRGSAKLPPILPLVIYHGATPWTVAPHFSRLVDQGPELGVRPLDFEMIVVDLGTIDDAELSNEPTLRAGLLALKYAARSSLQRGRLRVVLEALRKAAPSLLRTALHYMMETYQRIDRALLLGEARRVMPEHKERIMTIAQELREEGRVEGRVEGRREALLRVLGRRFGPVPKATRAQVMSASASELDGWLDRALDAPTLAQVFSAAH